MYFKDPCLLNLCLQPSGFSVRIAGDIHFIEPQQIFLWVYYRATLTYTHAPVYSIWCKLSNKKKAWDRATPNWTAQYMLVFCSTNDKDESFCPNSPGNLLCLNNQLHFWCQRVIFPTCNHVCKYIRYVPPGQSTLTTYKQLIFFQLSVSSFIAILMNWHH